MTDDKTTGPTAATPDRQDGQPLIDKKTKTTPPADATKTTTRRTVTETTTTATPTDTASTAKKSAPDTGSARPTPRSARSTSTRGRSTSTVGRSGAKPLTLTDFVNNEFKSYKEETDRRVGSLEDVTGAIRTQLEDVVRQFTETDEEFDEYKDKPGSAIKRTLDSVRGDVERLTRLVEDKVGDVEAKAEIPLLSGEAVEDAEDLRKQLEDSFSAVVKQIGKAKSDAIDEAKRLVKEERDKRKQAIDDERKYVDEELSKRDTEIHMLSEGQLSLSNRIGGDPMPTWGWGLAAGIGILAAVLAFGIETAAGNIVWGLVAAVLIGGGLFFGTLGIIAIVVANQRRESTTVATNTAAPTTSSDGGTFDDLLGRSSDEPTGAAGTTPTKSKRQKAATH